MSGNTYYLRRNDTGEEAPVPADKTREFFEFIENLTGLDRAMAAMIMRSGQTVEHPAYTFRSSMAASKQPGIRPTDFRNTNRKPPG